MNMKFSYFEILAYLMCEWGDQNISKKFEKNQQIPSPFKHICANAEFSTKKCVILKHPTGLSVLHIINKIYTFLQLGENGAVVHLVV